MNHKTTRQLNNKGMTMVELIVTFAILSIFMVATTMIMSSIVTLYFNEKEVTNSMEVVQFIQTKITGELENADASATTSVNFLASAEGGEYRNDGAIYIGSNSIEFTNKQGSHVTISTVENSSNGKYYFNEHFEGVSGGTTINPETNEEEPIMAVDAVDWQFDMKSYLGYSIESLTFKKAELVDSAFGSNIIQVNLTIVSKNGKSFDSVFYVDCYKFRNEDTNLIVQVE